MPASPAPRNSSFWSASLRFVMRSAAMMPATATAPVPWMSSSNRQVLSRYSLSSRNALVLPKSSIWMRMPGNTSFAACTNSAKSSSYSLPRTRRRSIPLYKGSFSSLSLFVPTSNMTGRHWVGGMPAQAVYSDNFPIGMPMPPAPRSPRPSMRSPSVTTIMRAFLCGQFCRISLMRPLSCKDT